MAKDIGLMVNPDRHFSNSKKIGELNGKTFNEAIDIFKERIDHWYILVGDTILKQKDSIIFSFGLMTINVIIIDLLSQYKYNLKRSEGVSFRAFLIKYIPEFGNNFKNDYKVKYYHPIKKKYIQKSANRCFTDYAQAFWEGFRCGIVHNAMILPFGRINTEPVNIIDEATWVDSNGDDRVDLVIQPINLFHRIKDIFNVYINNLKNLKFKKQRDNFKAKFKRDFGYQI